MSVLERFEAADPGFIETLTKCADAQGLRAFAERWQKDTRPWARAQLIQYVDQPSPWTSRPVLHRRNPEHRPLWKRLFKLCDESGDHELMALFMVQTDRGANWDLQMRFSGNTCAYLRRRAWRHFRHLGFRDASAYRETVLLALRRYEDEDLQSGRDLLRRWGLVHILFHESPHLLSTWSRWRLGPDRALSILKPAPAFPTAWEGRWTELLDLLAEARARTVRWWAMEMVRAMPGALSAVPAETVARLLVHADEEVRTFAATLLPNCAGLSALPIATWLRLLHVQDMTVLEAVCAAMQRSISADRLTPAQRLELACAASPSIARLGLRFLREAPLAPPDRPLLLALADAQAVGVGDEVVKLLQDQVGVDALLPCLDSTRKEVRRAAWLWYEESPLLDDPATWSRLLETPYDDVRLPMTRLLEARLDSRGLPRTIKADDLHAVWAAVLLGIRRGSRHKLSVLRMLTRMVEADPMHAAAAMRLLAVALRSVRPPERRAGLAAVVRLVVRYPDLGAEVARAFPELRIRSMAGV